MGNLAAKREIDEVCKSFFSAFCNEKRKKPKLHLLKKLFIKDALIIRNSGSSPEISDVAGFIKPREKILSNGTLTNFKEHELSERTDIFGNIAQRFSVYRKQGYHNGKFFVTKGIKTMQFVNTKSGWRVSSLAWDDEKEGLKIPWKLAANGNVLLA